MPTDEMTMRKNIAMGICLASLAVSAVCYLRHWLSLTGGLICASVVWQFAGWWLAGQMRAVFHEKATDFVKRPMPGALAGTIQSRRELR
jgi:hypothetical protein